MEWKTPEQHVHRKFVKYCVTSEKGRVHLPCMDQYL